MDVVEQGLRIRVDRGAGDRRKRAAALDEQFLGGIEGVARRTERAARGIEGRLRRVARRLGAVRGVARGLVRGRQRAPAAVDLGIGTGDVALGAETDARLKEKLDAFKARLSTSGIVES